MVLTHLSQSKVFQGWHKQYQHHSSTLNCEMRFAIFLVHRGFPGKAA
ncbi:S-formylglutathione hydrolase, partial [Vibrio vulnificus]|nr:S-formylglutathione hydrolase [Vibrio vulnificus]